jgi:hypothetical protein
VSRALGLATALVFLPAVSNAACAWVLWIDSGERLGVRDISAMRAFEEREACEAAAKMLMERRMYIPPAPTFVCFPDTIDPRNTKGGSR